ncbi:MAG: UDP-3-O-acyl-N-acetylglucosamine deacetylase [Oscillatoriaceae cyanobacterium]
MTNDMKQTTLARDIEVKGIGLHSGIEATVKLLPAPTGGRYFVRTDTPNPVEIAAMVTSVRQTTLSTELAVGDVGVRTTEHLLAALVGLGVDNVRIEISGPELPLLDGSAKQWVEAISAAGVAATDDDAALPPTLTEPVWVQQGDAFVAALPSPSRRWTYGIDFPMRAIGNQWHSWADDTASFTTDIAPARTFGFAEQIEQLRAAGLIKGGSLDNALVCSEEGWLNPPLRFPNEPARHKLLDLVGDISLLGTIPVAHFLAYKASHNLHVQLARLLVAL